MHWREPLTSAEQKAVIDAYDKLKLEVQDILSRWRMRPARLYGLLARNGVSLRAPGRGRQPMRQLSDLEMVQIIAAYEKGEWVRSISHRFGINPPRVYALVDAAGLPRRTVRNRPD